MVIGVATPETMPEGSKLNATAESATLLGAASDALPLRVGRGSPTVPPHGLKPLQTAKSAEAALTVTVTVRRLATASFCAYASAAATSCVNRPVSKERLLNMAVADTDRTATIASTAISSIRVKPPWRMCDMDDAVVMRFKKKENSEAVSPFSFCPFKPAGPAAEPDSDAALSPPGFHEMGRPLALYADRGKSRRLAARTGQRASDRRARGDGSRRNRVTGRQPA